MADTQTITGLSGEYVPGILVIDDEHEILQMVSLCLKQAGYRASLATSAEEAHSLLAENEFDAIITDVQMPGEDGIAFLAKVHQTLPGIPVIIMTGHAQLQVAVNAVKNGAFDFIHKPFDFSYLRSVVEKAVSYTKLLRMEKNYLSELEHMVASRTNDLKHALLQLDESNKALLKAANEKNLFLSTISHEMRTPMNGVIGGLDLLADTELMGDQREFLLMAQESANSMMELVNRMLTFADGMKTGICSSLEEIDLPAVIEAVSMSHRKKFTEKGLNLDFHVPPAVPQRVMSDGKQLSRLLDILLGNALKFTDRGGVRIGAALERIEKKRAVIRVTVSDSGVGIPSDMLEQIFEPFTQVDSSSTRRFSGMGLGLSIARQIAGVLNGTLHAESSPGAGSSFIFIMHADVI
jgi:signal transduction histidine kinase